MDRYASLAGRILICVIFLVSGYGKITSPSETAAYMTSKGFFAVPFFLVMAILFEVAGGLSLLLGFKARWGAFLLFLYLIPTTLIFHNFWAVPEAQQRMQEINFLKNLAIMGGLLMVTAHGAGALSMDGARKAPPTQS